MKSTFEIYIDFSNQEQLGCKFFTFPGGEVSVKLEQGVKVYEGISIIAFIRDAEGIMSLLMLKDAIDVQYPHVEVYLQLMYVPYARQDRVCAPGESNSLQVMARLIGGMGFDVVYPYDVHSEKTIELLEKYCTRVCQVKQVKQVDIMSAIIQEDNLSGILIAPDKGAKLKTLELAHDVDMPMVQAHKVRCPDTGKILETNLSDTQGLVKGNNCIIVDDICDGGYTFTELAKVLKAEGAKTVTLMVTHGIFSKGLDVLYDNGIDKVVTTNTFCQLIAKTPKFRMHYVG